MFKQFFTMVIVLLTVVGMASAGSGGHFKPPVTITYSGPTNAHTGFTDYGYIVMYSDNIQFTYGYMGGSGRMTVYNGQTLRGNDFVQRLHEADGLYNSFSSAPVTNPEENNGVNSGHGNQGGAEGETNNGNGNGGIDNGNHNGNVDSGGAGDGPHDDGGDTGSGDDNSVPDADVDDSQDGGDGDGDADTGADEPTDEDGGEVPEDNPVPDGDSDSGDSDDNQPADDNSGSDETGGEVNDGSNDISDSTVPNDDSVGPEPDSIDNSSPADTPEPVNYYNQGGHVMTVLPPDFGRIVDNTQAIPTGNVYAIYLYNDTYTIRSAIETFTNEPDARFIYSAISNSTIAYNLTEYKGNVIPDGMYIDYRGCPGDTP